MLLKDRQLIKESADIILRQNFPDSMHKDILVNLIISHLGLDNYLIDVINSAEVGFEKPNPKIFEVALGRAFRADDIWMIGDNYNADVWGAEQVGIKAILVRGMDSRAKYNFLDLYGVKNFLQAF